MSRNEKKNDNGEFCHYDRMVRKAEKTSEQSSVSSEVKSSSYPRSCKQCEYYQPRFKYRKCLFAECFYKKDVDVFRRKPHVRDRYS